MINTADASIKHDQLTVPYRQSTHPFFFETLQNKEGIPKKCEVFAGHPRRGPIRLRFSMFQLGRLLYLRQPRGKCDRR